MIPTPLSRIALLSFSLIMSAMLSAQPQGGNEPKQEPKLSKATAKAKEYYDAKEYSLALDALKEAFAKEDDREMKTEITFWMGQCYRNMSDYKNAEAQFKKAVKMGYGADARYWEAEMMKSQGNYEDAVIAFEELRKEHPSDKRAEAGISSCKNAAEWKSNPSRYQVTNIKELNSPARDMAPAWAGRPGEYNELYLISSREGALGKNEDGWTGQAFMDIWSSKSERKTTKAKGKNKGPVEESKWATPTALDEMINSPHHEGTLSFDSRRKELYFTRCKSEKRQVLGCAIYFTEKRGQTWAEPELVVLAPDSTYSVGHPSLSPDDKLLYFAGDLPGTKGGKDLWVTTFDRREKKWKEATNLGSQVNTDGDELFPFAHDDGYLYFSSDGHPGMGSQDIFRVPVGADGMPTGPAENMKYPINTEYDDFGIILEAGGARKGYISSNRKDGRGSDDIYSIYEVPLNFMIEGIVSSTKDGKPIPQVTVRLDGSDGTSVVANSDGSGRYVFEKEKVKEGVSYTLNFEKKKFLNNSGYVTTVGVPFNAFEYDVANNLYLHTLKLDKGLEPIEVPIVLPNVLFDLAKWDLRPESMQALDSVVTILKNNPTVVIELRSHTDYRDSDEKNNTLSQNRANSCVEYLISKGIESGRLVAVGKGETEPLTIPENYKGLGAGQLKSGATLTESYIKSLPANLQEVANQVNRRTDFKVLRDDYVPNQAAPEAQGTGTGAAVGTGAAAGAGAKAEAGQKGQIHSCVAGDNFAKVAKEYGISVADLKKLNNGLRGVRVFEGLELKVTKDGDYSDFDSKRYQVQTGETSLKAIAKKLNMDDKALKELNGDLKDKDLQPGLYIFVK